MANTDPVLSALTNAKAAAHMATIKKDKPADAVVELSKAVDALVLAVDSMYRATLKKPAE